MCLCIAGLHGEAVGLRAGQGRHGGVQLPAQRAQDPPYHARGRRLARAAHAHVPRRARRAVRLHRAVRAVAGSQGRRRQGLVHKQILHANPHQLDLDTYLN